MARRPRRGDLVTEDITSSTATVYDQALGKEGGANLRPLWRLLRSQDEAVQQEFRSNPPEPDWSDHKFWAAWQLTGDSTPLPPR